MGYPGIKMFICTMIFTIAAIKVNRRPYSKNYPYTDSEEFTEAHGYADS